MKNRPLVCTSIKSRQWRTRHFNQDRSSSHRLSRPLTFPLETYKLFQIRSNEDDKHSLEWIFHRLPVHSHSSSLGHDYPSLCLLHPAHLDGGYFRWRLDAFPDGFVPRRRQLLNSMEPLYNSTSSTRPFHQTRTETPFRAKRRSWLTPSRRDSVRAGSIDGDK